MSELTLEGGNKSKCCEARRKKLEERFPGMVYVVSEGTILFRSERNPQEAIQRNSFVDPEKPRRWCHFTRKPQTEFTNVSVINSDPLILFDAREKIGRQKLVSLADTGGVGVAGFDGFIAKERSMYLPEDDPIEIVITGSNLHVFDNNISPYAS